MRELGKSVVGVRLCHSVFHWLVMNVTSKVCGSGTKTGANTWLPGELFDGFVYDFITCKAHLPWDSD